MFVSYIREYSAEKIGADDALQAGIQIHIFGSAPGQRSESNLQGVTITPKTVEEMNQIHKQCAGFPPP